MAPSKRNFQTITTNHQNILEGWSPGVIGSALSHMLSWRICLQLGKPIVVAEDDAILAKKMKKNLNTILERGYEPFSTSWMEPDSLLQAEIIPSLGLISLLNPPIPRKKNSKNLLTQSGETNLQTETLLWPSRISNNTRDSIY